MYADLQVNRQKINHKPKEDVKNDHRNSSANETQEMV
jgi:hypothetical protein